MNYEIKKKVESKYIVKNSSLFRVGDTVKVHNIIREADKSRVQIFRGIVIAKKGSGIQETFTVRKISDGIGVEKIFPLQSPNVEKIEIVKTGKTRSSKLYFMRDRIGKSALKVKQGRDLNINVIESTVQADTSTKSEDSDGDTAKNTNDKNSTSLEKQSA